MVAESKASLNVPMSVGRQDHRHSKDGTLRAYAPRYMSLVRLANSISTDDGRNAYSIFFWLLGRSSVANNRNAYDCESDYGSERTATQSGACIAAGSLQASYVHQRTYNSHKNDARSLTWREKTQRLPQKLNSFAHKAICLC